MQIGGIGNSQASWAARRQQMFNTADTNGDGSLDITEFTTMMSSRPAPPSTDGNTPPSAEDLFAKFDTDGNGQLSQDELDAGMKSIRQAFHAHRHHRDNDGDGDDGVAGASSVGALSAADLFAKIDTNSDGAISIDELTAALTPPSDPSIAPVDTGSTDTSTSASVASSSATGSNAATAGDAVSTKRSDIELQRQLHYLLEAFASQFNVTQQLQAA